MIRSVVSTDSWIYRLPWFAIYHIYGKYWDTIAPDKSGYYLNILLISARKYMLWVLIRSAGEALLISTYNEHFYAEIEKFWLK